MLGTYLLSSLVRNLYPYTLVKRLPDGAVDYPDSGATAGGFCSPTPVGWFGHLRFYPSGPNTDPHGR